MDRTQQRCLISSTAIHGGLLLIVLLLSGLAARQALQPEVPFMEIIPTDLRLTMGTQIGGGNPNPRPLAAAEGTPPPPTVVAPPPVQTRPPSPPEARAQSKPVPTPKAADPPVEVSREVQTPAKAQDVDQAQKADKPNAPEVSRIQVSKQTRNRNEVDQQTERESRTKAEAESQSRDRRLAAAQKLASRLTGAAAGVSKNAGGSTQIEMPGPGGAAYAPYLSWLQTFLYEQWRRPATSSQQQDWVGLEVTIARDGTVLAVEITHPSGLRPLDASAEEVFRRHRRLRPLPDEFKEPRLVVPVKFVLEAPGSQ